MEANQITQALNEVKADIGEWAKGAKSKIEEQDDRLLHIERSLSKSSGAWAGGGETKSIGELVTDSDQCKTFLSEGRRNSGRITVGSFFPPDTKSVIISSGSLYALPTRVPDISAAYVPLRVRDLLTTSPCGTNAVEFIAENASGTANNAASQGAGSSPQVYEAIAKAESTLAFKLTSTPVQTLAHYVNASRQVLDDSLALRNFINRRMIYFLKLVEENQLLNGTGAGGDLTGLMYGASPYSSPSPIPPGETRLDAVRRAIGQVQKAGFNPSGVVLNADDFTGMALIKTTGTASSGEYIFGDPHSPGPPSAWGLPLVVSSKMAAGSFLVGDFSTAGCELWDRMQSTVEISYEHASNFVLNVASLLCEERLALTIYQASAFVSGNY
jgi:HK97 family phage major capsid protein